MSRTCRISILIFLPVLAFLLPERLDAQGGKSVPSIGIPSGESSKTAPPAKPPDLVVGKISLDGKCYLHFILSNVGGAVPAGEFSAGTVSVSWPGGKKVLLFPKIDPKGVLKKPGSSLSVRAPLRIEESGAVKIVVDAGSAIGEGNEKNNSAGAKFSPACGGKKGKAGKTPPGAPGGVGSGTAGAAAPRGPAEASKAASYLDLERIYLDGGEIRVVIVRRGASGLPESAWKRGFLEVKSKSLKGSWKLAEIDRRKSLLQGKKKLDFRTGLMVTRRERVVASLHDAPLDRTKEAVLTPPAAAVTGKKMTPLSGVGETGKKGGGSLFGTKAKKPAAPLLPGSSERPEWVTFGIDMGIEVTLEATRRFFFPGERLTFRYRYSDGDRTPSERTERFWFHKSHLSHDSTGLMLLISERLYDWSLSGDGWATVSFTIPPTILESDDSWWGAGTYVVRVSAAETVFGVSDRFSVGDEIGDSGGEMPGHDLFLIHPDGGESWIVGEESAVRWQYHGDRTRVPNWVVEVLRGGRGVHAERYPAAENPLEPETGIVGVNLTMPDHLATGDDYRIRVTGGDLVYEGRGDFSIVPPFEFERPSPGTSGMTYYLGEWVPVYCRIRSTARWSGPVEATVRRRDGSVAETLDHWRDSWYERRMDYSWYPGRGCDGSRGPVYLGSGYRFRIEDRDNPDHFVESGEFSIDEPEIDVRSPAAGDVWHLGDSVRIAWSAPNIMPDSTLAIYLENDGGRATIARGVPNRHLAFRWNVGDPPVDESADPGEPEGVPMEWATGTMGGPGPLLGTFTLVVELENCRRVKGRTAGTITLEP